VQNQTPEAKLYQHENQRKKKTTGQGDYNQRNDILNKQRN